MQYNTDNNEMTRQEWLLQFQDIQGQLNTLIISKELLYIYTNGYVLPNVPNIQGGIFNNNAATKYDLWLRSAGYGEWISDRLYLGR